MGVPVSQDVICAIISLRTKSVEKVEKCLNVVTYLKIILVILKKRL